MKITTKAVGLGVAKDRTGSISFPIYQTSTFAHPAFGESTGYDYSRSGNPTRHVLEEGIAQLEGGCRGFAYASGLAALSGILLLFEPGDHFVVTEDLYGGTFRLLDKVFRKYGLKSSYVDTSNLADFKAALTSQTKAVILETPTNPLLKIADIQAISNICKDKQILLIVDNTFLTPYLQKPLDLGADIVVHSASKYLSGHNDVVAGLVVAKDEALAEKIYFYQNSVGAVLGPQDSWLIIRGIKTLGIRMDRQESNAKTVASWLNARKDVLKVFYPGLTTHPGFHLQQKQASGFGAMIAFEVENQIFAEKILNNVKIISYAESLGGVESLITFPSYQTHADMLETERERVGINNRLLRLSVGIEDIDDLLEDLHQALEAGGS